MYVEERSNNILTLFVIEMTCVDCSWKIMDRLTRMKNNRSWMFWKTFQGSKLFFFLVFNPGNRPRRRHIRDCALLLQWRARPVRYATHKHTLTSIFHFYFGHLWTIALHHFCLRASPGTAELRRCLALLLPSDLQMEEKRKNAHSHSV